MRAGIECKISLAKKLPITLGGLRTLSFDLGTFANASDRYILAQNPSTGLYEMTGTFGANVLATRNIVGVEYAQIESQDKNIISNSLDYGSWAKTGILSITDNADTDPLSGSTACLVIPNTSSGTHAVYDGTIDIDSGEYYTFAFLAKENGYSWLRAYFSSAGFPSPFSAYFDVANGVVGTTIACTAEILDLTNGWYLCVVHTVQANATVTNHTVEIDCCPSNGVISWSPNGTDGYLFWHSQMKPKAFNSSLIPTVGSPVIRSPDVLYFPSAAIPTWMKSKFTTKLIPNYDIPYTTEDKPLWSFNKTAATLDTGHGYQGVAHNSTTVFWCDYSGTISSIPIGGGSRASVVTGETAVTDMAIDASDNLYWTDYTNGKIRKKIGASSPVDLVTGLTNPFSLCVDDTNGKVYWIDYTAGLLQSSNLDGSSVATIKSGLVTPRGCATDSVYIYYKSNDNIYKIPVAGGTAILLASTQYAYQIAVNDQSVFWSSLGAGELRCVSKNGGAVSNVWSETGVYGVDVSNNAIFIASTTASGTLKRRDSVTAWLTTAGKVKVVDGPDTKVETSAATASMHDNLEVEFDRVNGKITLSGFTTGDGEYTDTAWTSPDGFDVEYSYALGGAAQSDALVSYPIG